jgi:predicted nuclease with RNAse H fold
MAHLDELGVAVRAVEGAEERVDAVARIAVDAVDAPVG